jgi:hypothetical protein
MQEARLFRPITRRDLCGDRHEPTDQHHRLNASGPLTNRLLRT